MTKLELAQAVKRALEERSDEEFTPEIEGDIPPNLATATWYLLKMHARNGDLGWVYDLMLEVQNEPKDGNA